MSLRRIEQLGFALLWLITAWYWFGASGVALLGLWLLSRGIGEARIPPASVDWRAALEARGVRFAHLLPWRVFLRLRGGGEILLYRDELPASDWALLCRECRRG